MNDDVQNAYRDWLIGGPQRPPACDVAEMLNRIPVRFRNALRRHFDGPLDDLPGYLINGDGGAWGLGYAQHIGRVGLKEIDDSLFKSTGRHLHASHSP